MYLSAAYMSQMMAIYSQQQQQNVNLSALVSADPYFWAMFSPFAGTSGMPMELGCPPPPPFSVSPMERPTANGFDSVGSKRQPSVTNSVSTPSTPECRPTGLRSPSMGDNSSEKKKKVGKTERSASRVSEPISNGICTPTDEQPLDLSVKKSPKSGNSPINDVYMKSKSLMNSTSFKPVNQLMSKTS